ncbi:four helix bundle protein [uncultured Mediterranea sp.]|uniref:four helix bundle protein n=1 Tax=uncultured Mediterranea sp. TaxID=1926662 RepID=UPI0027D98013|nr:four helix bundle protein [uncultured Mediterranea sp.]
MTQSFKDLIAWQKAHEFVLLVYKFTNTFPSHERFGLMSQFQRAAVSIAANIAEGYKKTGKSDKLRLMNVAQGSLEECRYYILLSKDLKYITEEISSILTERIENVSRLLNAYCKAVQGSKFADIIEDS